MILDEQTNKVYISEHTCAEHPLVVRRILKALDSMDVDWELLKHTKDSWCRDYMPVQISKSRFIQYRYFPDYLNTDALKEYITDPTETLASIGIETTRTDIIMDGGNVIKCGNIIIMTDKVFQENPSYTHTALIDELERLFECEILFLPWDMAEPYGHADGIVRYVSPGKVLMTNYNDYDSRFFERWIKILSGKFDVEVLQYSRKTFGNNWAYINFLQTKEAIFVPVFGKEEDEQALSQIGKYYAAYHGHIVPVRLNSIVKDGGALNCISWNIQRY